MQKNSNRSLEAQRGSTMVEYAILVSLLTLASLSSVTNIGFELRNIFTGVGSTMQGLAYSAGGLTGPGDNTPGGYQGPGGSDTDDTPVFIPTSSGD